MAKTNKTRYALLGMLTLGPMSGYDIKQAIEGSIGNFWAESYGQIYPILKSFVAEGLATVTVQEQDVRPDRKVYTLTEAGRRTLQAWLAQPADDERRRVELLLRLFFGGETDVQTCIAQVNAYRAKRIAELERYAAIEAHLTGEPHDDPALPYWLMTTSYGRHYCTAMVAWCDETLATLAALACDADSSPPAEP